MATCVAPPKGTGRVGRALWVDVLTRFDLAGHELLLLRQAVRLADRAEALNAILAEEGLLRGARVHPAAVELRQVELTLARLVVALRIPVDDQEDRTQRRGIRGVYQGGRAG